MILGVVGNVGAYALQMALDAGLSMVAVAAGSRCAIAPQPWSGDDRRLGSAKF